MRTNKSLQIEQLDKKLHQFFALDKVIVPTNGWINSIRTTLNMTLEQLGRQLNITKQGAKKIEESEAAGSISLKSLKEVGEVLNLNFVYGFVPKNGSLENLINDKAQEMATKIVMRTNQHMKLENQENSEERIQSAIIDLASDLKRELNKSLWD